MNKTLKSKILVSFLFTATCLVAVIVGCVSVHQSKNLGDDTPVEAMSGVVGLGLNPEQLTAAQHMDIIEGKVIKSENPEQPDGCEAETWSRLELAKTGNRVPIEKIPGGMALGIAATYYAISTLDFAVTLSEVIDSGLWPYDTIPDGIDLDDELYDFPVNEQIINNGDLAPGKSIGSPEWRVVAKWHILHCFYDDYFRRNNLDRLVLADQELLKQFVDSDSANSHYYNNVQTNLSGYSLEELPLMNQLFWTNDITGKPAEINTKVKGDFGLRYLSDILFIRDTTNNLNKDILVPDIFLNDLSETSYNYWFGYDKYLAEADEETIKTVSFEWCCFYVEYYKSVAMNQPAETFDWDCVCDACGKVIGYCEYTIGSMNGTWEYWDWKLVGIFPCGDLDEVLEQLPPGSNVVARKQGERAPATRYEYTADLYYFLVHCVDAGEHLLVCLNTVNCLEELYDYLDTLVTSTTKSGSIPGDVCMTNGQDPEPDNSTSTIRKSCCKPRVVE